MSKVRATSTTLLQWLGLGALVGVLSGIASAVFLVLLDVATAVRTTHPFIVFALPLAGLALGWVYERLGRDVRAGNNLVIDTLHDGGPKLPLRMAPMVLLGTVFSHLFGASAGREGTAVQMGASLSDAVSHRFSLSPAMRQSLLTAGVAGGFGSVFGTPWAGALFGMEFVVLGRLQWRALVPAVVAAFVGDATTRALGVGHTQFPVAPSFALTPKVALAWCGFGVAVALTGVVFIELTHALRRWSERWTNRLPLGVFAGGIAVVLLWQLVGTDDYLGLGVPTMVRAFSDSSVSDVAFAWKLLFTAVTLGAGFVGGEVTPLFFIGATLGNAAAPHLGLPLPLAAAVGMVAMFGACANAPLALTVMAIELFGLSVLPHAALVCCVAYVLTGRRSIYGAQRVSHSRMGRPLGEVRRLSDGKASDRAARPGARD